VMQTGGYDIVVEANETLINKFLKLGHCMGKFPTFKGTYELPIPNIPDSLKEFTIIGYEVSLAKAPVIEITNDLHLKLNARGEAKFTVLGGIEFELEVEFDVGIVPSFNQATRRLHVEFVQATLVDAELDDTYHLPANVIAKLNQIIAIAMEEYLTDDITTIELSPVLFSTELPYMPPGEENKLTIGLGNIKLLNPSVLAVAINLLGYNGGNVNSISDFTDGNHIGIGVNEAAMHRIYDFWWGRTTHPKSVTQTGTHQFDVPAIIDVIDDIPEWVTGLATLGLVTTDVEVDKIWADFGATVRFGKFDFDLKPGNIVQVSGSISLDAWVKLLVQITTTVEILWGWIEVSSDTYTNTLIDISTPNIGIIINSATGNVYLDAQNRLLVDIIDLDITIPLDWAVPEFLLNYVVNWIIDRIVDNLPPIVLGPAMIEQTIPDSSVTVTATINKLFIDEPEALVAANIETSGLATYAPYVVNKNPISLEVHKKDCEWAHRISLAHRGYYCDLEEALAAGYDGCYYCLPKYHHR
jgi:hypothetical protein